MSNFMEINFQELELQSLRLSIADDDKKLEVDKFQLTEEERLVLDRQLVKQETYPTPFRFLFNCATSFDLALLAISLIAAAGSGLVFPISDLLLGNMGQSFRGFFVGETSLHKFDSQVSKFSLSFVYLAVGNLFASFISIVGFTYAGERIVQQVRQRYLQAILRQNVAFFDTIGVGEVNNCITTDTKLIQDAITIKACFLVAAFSNFCGAIVISFVKNWRLALILLPSIVLMILSMGIGAFFMVKNSQKAQEASERAANIAQEAISSIATTLAFNMQSPLLQKFKKHAATARVYQFRSGVALGSMMAAINAVIWWTYGFAFWEGSRLFVKGQVDVSSILTVLFAILTGSFALGNVAPHAEAIVKGLTSTKKLSATIFRESPIDPSSTEGGRIDDIHGDISLTNIRHVYPSRPDFLVMDGVNLHFPAGKTTAIVGPSGGGKSTIIGLLERFFEPVSGTIKIDGHDIASLNLTWLRQQIGLVSQEPTIFSTTVFENIRYGLIGTPYEHKPEEEIKDLVERAAKKANAYDFIQAMPEGFHSHVGGGGFLLSGGQKQRITIARAIVADPKILLLDEATSALDSKSEWQVQAALSAAALGRTTIVIAHRLSTIVNSDNIVVLSAGRVVEQGTHQELLALKSVYYKLTEQQRCLTKSRNENDQHHDGYDSAQEELTLAEKRLSGKPLLGKLMLQGAAEDEEEPITNETMASPKKPATIMELVSFCFRLNQRMLLPICGGLVFSVIAGGSHPTQSVFMAKVMQALSSPPSQFGHLRNEVNFWSAMYLLIGFTTIIGLLGQALFFVFYSEHLTYRARWRTFDTILHQDMATFFLPAYSTANLSMLLSHSAMELQGMGGVTAGTILIILTIIIAGIILAISVGWKLGLVCTCTIPILFAAGVMQLKSQAILEAQAKKVHEASAHVACEYSTNIRTVAALTMEDKVMAEYRQVLDENRRTSLFLIAQSSLLFAFSQSAVFLSSSLAFWYGSRLIVQDHYTIFQFYVCYTALIAGAYSAGAIFTFVPDMGKASAAAQSIKDFHERETLLDPRKEYGDKTETMAPSVQFKNVSFGYPNSNGKLVLNNVSLSVQPGQFIALVGASGSGKSTVVSLLERFFDANAGQVMVGGRAIRDWNLRDYRNQLALVGQLPVLYEGTIRENIVLESSTEVSQSRLQQVCRDANIWDYIVSLPEGLETQVGPRGTLLSGGQKQRIAIARALLRDPKILLLDEATSALDSESERIVQAALDEAAQGRTTVAVAHRISTVQNADCIYVLDQGCVVESGTHQQLLAKKGKYHELVQLQNIEDL